MKWVEHVASHPGDKGKGLLACAVGKTIHLFDQAGQKLKELPHPSAVTGLAFDAKGKRVAASHYNGATLWFVAAKTDSPRKLEWKGSHTALAIHPDGDAVVTAMQENALHGWRLSDGQHMRMSGYPSKTQTLTFTRNGKWLASSGADAMVLWPFFGGGPMGKAPIELAGGDGISAPRSPAIRCRRWSPAVSPTGWWCWPTSIPPASCRWRPRSTVRSPRWPGARTARSSRSARRRGSQRSSTCRSANSVHADGDDALRRGTVGRRR